jgi:uncharacterized membrane protein
MDGRSVAWIGYVPIPGLALVAVMLRPEDRLVRFHAWQATVLVVGTYVVLLLIGFLTMVSDAKAYTTAIGILSGAILLGALALLGAGFATSAMGRFSRLRPAWDIAALLRRN